MTVSPRIDFHIHTRYLGCANETMEVAAIARACARLGVERIGITDHLNSLDRLPLHPPILRDIEELDAPIEVYFGVELNYTACDGAFAFSAEIREEYGFQFAIGGIHGTYLDAYDLQGIIDVQHRHHLKTCEDPLVDVLVHPYWFGKREFDNRGWPWFDSMRAVPERYVRELGQAAKATGTAIEINVHANLANPAFSERYAREYLDFLAVLAEEGATFSLGSDAHDIRHLELITVAWQAAETLGLTPDRIWQPATGPVARSLTPCSRGTDPV